MWGGAASVFRLFRSEFGGQISWLLPAALLSLAALVWVSRRAPRTSRVRAAALIWGGWVIVTGGVFSYMNGIIHPYYMIALAPGIGALVGIGATALWQARLGTAGRVVAALAIGVTGWWAYVLLGRTPGWLPWLRWVVVLAAVLGAGAVLAGPVAARAIASRVPVAGQRRVLLGVLPGAAAVLALLTGLAGPAAYALDTVGTTHTGAIPTAGPAGIGGGPGGGAGGGAGGGPGGAAGTGARGFPGQPGSTGGMGGTGGLPRGGAGGPGGLGGSTQVSAALTTLLERDASRYKWVAATEGSEGAAPLELATGDAVMAIGGFNGTDPWPTLAAFKKLVALHEVHYYVGQSGQSFGGGQGSSAIASWVAASFTKQTVGGQTVYDLTSPR